VGTLSGRLTTAHRLLSKRLARHGLVVSGAALSAALAEQSNAGVPFEVISSTIRAAALFADGSAASAGIVPCKAASLAEGVLKTMLLSKLKLASAMLTSVVVIGAGLLALEGPGSGRAQPPRESPAAAPPKRGSIEEEQIKTNLESARKKIVVDEAKLRQAEANLERAKAQLEVANAQLQRAKLDYDEARARATKSQVEPLASPTQPKPGRAVLEVRGYLRPARSVQVTSSVAGKVTEVHAQEGDPVSAGQLLASLDSGSFRNDVERAQVNIELARARLGEAKAGQSDGKNQQNVYTARVQVAEAELKRAEIELAQAKSQLDKTQLRAPIAGIVSRRQVEVGDSVNPLQGQPEATRLFELIDPRMLVVVVPIPERDIGIIQQSQRVRVETDALPGTSLDGKVERVAPTVEPADATLKVRIALKIPDGDMRWKPGMSVRVAFLAKE
jgi:RND family efflux transporter MFP subunit